MPCVGQRVGAGPRTGGTIIHSPGTLSGGGAGRELTVCRAAPPMLPVKQEDHDEHRRPVSAFPYYAAAALCAARSAPLLSSSWCTKNAASYHSWCTSQAPRHHHHQRNTHGVMISAKIRFATAPLFALSLLTGFAHRRAAASLLSPVVGKRSGRVVCACAWSLAAGSQRPLPGRRRSGEAVGQRGHLLQRKHFCCCCQWWAAK